MLGIGGAATLAGCLGGDDETEPGDDTAPGDDEPLEELPEPSGTYTTVVSSGFETLNPLYNNVDGAGTAIGRALDVGYTFNPDTEVIPLHFDLSSDDGGSVWVLDIRENLEFSDPYGQVTAETYEYQINEVHRTDWAATAYGSDWQEVENVEATGEFELQVELPSANVLWPETGDPQTIYPIPIDILEPHVEEEDREGLEEHEDLLDLTFTGNLGPYEMIEWERGSGTQYVRNDDYYLREHDEVYELFGNAPYFEEATIEVVEEESSRLGMLQSGEADSVGIPPERVEEFQEDSEVSVYVSPQPYNETIAPNMRDNGWNAGPGNMFRYKEFRQAMACAISKETVVEGVFRGFATPHYTWQPEWSRWYPDDRDIPKWGTGDLYGPEVAREKAEEAFAQSDYDYEFDGETMVNPDGDQVELEFYTGAGSDTRNLMAEVCAQELEENLGMEIDVQTIDTTQFDQNYFMQESPEEPVESEELGMAWDEGAFNAGPRSVTSEEPWDLHNVFGYSTAPRNPLAIDTFWDGPDTAINERGWYPDWPASDLFDQARQADDEDELQQIMGEIFEEIAYDQSYILIAFDDATSGYGTDIVGPRETYDNWPASTFYRE